MKLTSKAIEALKHHLERQLGEIDGIGSLWSENGPIFVSEMGEPFNRHNLTRCSLKPLLKRTGLPQIRFHDLRYTCATLSLTRNVNPKIVSEMLGHWSIAITLDTYPTCYRICGTRQQRRLKRPYRSLPLPMSPAILSRGCLQSV